MALGEGPYEGYVEGAKLVGGGNIRNVLSYERSANGLPVVLNGSLYKSKIAAIMSYKYPLLSIG